MASLGFVSWRISASKEHPDQVFLQWCRLRFIRRLQVCEFLQVLGIKVEFQLQDECFISRCQSMLNLSLSFFIHSFQNDIKSFESSLLLSESHCSDWQFVTLVWLPHLIDLYVAHSTSIVFTHSLSQSVQLQLMLT